MTVGLGLKPWIEHDGETDRWGIAIQTRRTRFQISDLTRDEIKFIVKVLSDELGSLLEAFPNSRGSSQ